MGAAAAEGEEELSAAVGGGGGGGKELERILVSVRVRPLNGKEMERGDCSDWDCVNGTTVVFKHPPPNERALFPTSYKFDRVFGKDVSTRQVYEEGAKEVALSVVKGINSSIFAYGQTSSGKTYTMTGITEYGVADIYQYIKKHGEREFTLKFSAMEIYNEAVRDLLSTDSTPLRLLDDPEKGTIVEKLIEETLRDHDHLRELLSVCEAQRQIGETNLNEMSSRSHQILRLTIESSTKVYSGRDSSSTLVACVNFVDLAGSERASQAMSAGMRLKEGCHINRSLLTLGTVIRKLSKGGRNGHVPYRDSKLTRILQPALGGNARTAIICTMSPAHSHVEQSRNTLLFASCAKEVVTNARVNLVMSDKALIKHLQRELTKLESELRFAGSGLGDCTSHAEALKEKDAKIRKLENDLRDLMLERDHAQSRLDDLLRSSRDEPSSRQWDELSRTSGTHEHSPSSEVFSNSETFEPLQRNREYRFTFSETPNVEDSDLEGRHSRQPSSPGMYNLGFSQSHDRGFAPLSDMYEEHCKEVQCVEINNLVSRTQSDNFSILLPEDTDNLLLLTDADKLERHEVLTSDDSELPVKADDDLNDDLKSVSTTKMVDIFAAPEPRVLSSTDSGMHNGADYKSFSKRVDDDFGQPDMCVVQSDSCDDLHEPNHKSLSFAERVDQPSAEPKLPSDVDQDVEKSIIKKVDSFNEPESNVKVDKDQQLPESFDQEKHNQTDKAMARFVKLSADVAPLIKSSSGCLTRSRSCRASLMLTSALIEDLHNRDNMTPPDTFYKETSVRPEKVRRSLYAHDSENMENRLSVIKSHVSERFAPDKVEEEKPIAQGQSEKKIDPSRRAMSEDISVMNDVMKGTSGFNPMALGPIVGSPSRWPLEFEKKQQEIIELWHVCNVSLVHRTHFFLLFNGDPADAIYMEVELRRLSFLKNNFATGGNTIVSTSVKTLKREREMLYRQMLKKLNTQERENVYTKWGIVLSSKQRRWQLARLVWTNTDREHVRESASLVANLIGLSEPGQTLKQMVELSFSVTPPRISRLSFSFRGASYD